LQPNQEWYVIQQEPTLPAQLYTGYIIPLSAIGLIASIIGLSIFSYGLYSLPIPFVIITRLVLFILGLGGIYVTALVIDALAPNFSGQKNIYQALKLVAYCHTPFWLGQVFNIIPLLGILGFLIGLYSFYLLYLGVPIMMQVPQDKAVGYIVVAIVVMIVIYFIIFAIVGAITAPFLVGRIMIR